MQNFGYVSEIVKCLFLTKTADEAYREWQWREFPIGMLHAPEEPLDDKHLAARGFCKRRKASMGRSGTPARLTPSAGSTLPPARLPRLGQHHHEALLAELAPELTIP